MNNGQTIWVRLTAFPSFSVRSKDSQPSRLGSLQLRRIYYTRQRRSYQRVSIIFLLQKVLKMLTRSNLFNVAAILGLTAIAIDSFASLLMGATQTARMENRCVSSVHRYTKYVS